MKKQYEDIDLDISLDKLDSDLRWKKTIKNELKERILTNIENLESNEKNINPFRAKNRKGSLTGKIAYSCIVLIMFIGLIIGSGFISPVMAEVLSNFPYLNQVFKSEPITTTIMNKLQKSGYEIVGVSIRGKNIKIGVNESYRNFQDIQKEVKEVAVEVLKSRNYDAYKVEVVKENSTYEKPSPEQLKLIEEAMRVEGALQQELEKINNDVTTQVGEMPNSKGLLIVIGIPNTEKAPEAIKESAQNVVKENTEKEYKIEFVKIDLAGIEQENRWLRVLIPIFDGLNSKKEYQIRDFSFSSQSPKMRIYFYTDVLSSNPESKQLGVKIENTVKGFLESEEAREFIEDDEYKIIVYSKDKKKLN